MKARETLGDPEERERRRFLNRLTLICGGISAGIVGLPSLGYLLGLRKGPAVWRQVGKVKQFRIGTTVAVAFLDPSPLPWAGITSRSAAWLRREGEEEFLAFALNCTHLGCPVRWLAEADLFMCPCHGGVYYKNGDVASGPPGRALTRYPVRVREGVVEILASPLPIT